MWDPKNHYNNARTITLREFAQHIILYQNVRVFGLVLRLLYC